MPVVSRIRGPIVSVAQTSDHLGFFCDALGLVAGSPVLLDQSLTAQLTGVPSRALYSVFLQHAPGPFGVRVWRFDPPAAGSIRDPSRGTDLDALKVIDFYAPDFDTALLSLRTAGFEPKADIAVYELPEGEFREAHFWRPDDIVCAVITGPESFMAKTVTSAARTFSEPQSISAPVSDAAAVEAFYRDVLGLAPVLHYEIENPSFDALVGTDQPLNLRAINMGVKLAEPYLGLIDYGHVGTSLLGRSRPPMRGLMGIEVETSDLDAILAAASNASCALLAGPTSHQYSPYGSVTSALLEGPHGAIHHIIQT